MAYFGRGACNPRKLLAPRSPFVMVRRFDSTNGMIRVADEKLISARAARVRGSKAEAIVKSRRHVYFYASAGNAKLHREKQEEQCRIGEGGRKSSERVWHYEMPIDPFQSILDNIYELIDDEKYEEALRLIECIPGHENRDSVLLVYKASCIYEQGDDLQCLEVLRRFLVQYPGHAKVNYCLFTVAVCLENLGMEDKALEVLQQVSKEYPDCLSKVTAVGEVLEVKQAARGIVRDLLHSSFRKTDAR